MHHSKKSFSKALPSDLSRIAIAVISVNAAIISPNLLAEDSKTLPNLIVSGEKVDKDIKDTTTAVTVFSEENYESGEVKEVNEIAVQAPNVTSAGFGTINIRGINGAGAATGAEAYATGSKPRIATTVDGVTEAWGDTIILQQDFGTCNLLKCFAAHNQPLKEPMRLVVLLSLKPMTQALRQKAPYV